MQRNLKLNPHGVAGILFIVLMFGIAFFLNWNVNWWYFSIAVVLYSLVVISLSIAEPGDFRWMLGCHLALLFLAGGLFLEGRDTSAAWGYFVGSIAIGLAIPFMIFNASSEGGRLHPFLNFHGLAALGLIILMLVAIVFFSRGISIDIYVGFAEIIIPFYGMAIIYLSPCCPLGTFPYPNHRGRIQFGCHLACLFLIVGIAFHFKDVGSALGYFLASIAAGLAIPYLLFKVP